MISWFPNVKNSFFLKIEFTGDRLKALTITLGNGAAMSRADSKQIKEFNKIKTQFVGKLLKKNHSSISNTRRYESQFEHFNCLIKSDVTLWCAPSLKIASEFFQNIYKSSKVK